MRNALSLVLESMKHVIEFFIYVFSTYHLLTFYYLYSSFIMLYIYVITLYLVFIPFAYSIKFIYSYHLPYNSLLYMLLSTIILV